MSKNASYMVTYKLPNGHGTYIASTYIQALNYKSAIEAMGAYDVHII